MWRLEFIPGQLKAVSRRNGKTVLETSVQTFGDPYRIILRTAKPTLNSGENEMGFVEISVVDANGFTVQTADNAINLSVQGAGKLAATDNGNPVGLAPFNASNKQLFNGRLLAIVKTTGEKGPITVEVTSPGLKTASLIMRAN
jgi:beta-galactosidase